ncbi:hypothetical protein BDK51DRAFT_27866, partial [Blyttiomyces helicus]
CGGGSRFRTGKWRPKELFEDGRRTCSLSHRRIGKSKIEFQTLALPHLLFESPTPENKAFLDTIIAFFLDSSKTHYFAPKTFESGVSPHTYEHAQEVIAEVQDNLVDFLTTPPPPLRRRYLSIVWCLLSPRIKKALNDPTRMMKKGEEKPRVICGFTAGEWAIKEGVLFMSFGSTANSSADLYFDLQAKTLERIRKDSRGAEAIKEGLEGPPLAHLWTTVRKEERAVQADINSHPLNALTPFSPPPVPDADCPPPPPGWTVPRARCYPKNVLTRKMGFRPVKEYVADPPALPGPTPTLAAFSPPVISDTILPVCYNKMNTQIALHVEQLPAAWRPERWPIE